MKNLALYTALFNYTKKVTDLLKEKTSKKGLPRYPKTIWVRQKSAMYFRSQINQPVWTIPFLEIKDNLKALEEYKVCEKILREAPVIANQLDTLVGSYALRVRREADSIINLILFHHFAKVHLDFDAKLFESIYKKMEDELYDDYLIVERLTPLCGFKSTQKEIKLSKNISINKLDKDEIIHLLNRGIQLGAEFFQGLYNVVEFAIRVTIRSPKIIGNNNEIKNKNLENNLLHSENHVRKIIEVLRCYKRGEMRLLGTYTFTRSIFYSGLSMTPFVVPSFLIRDTFILNKKEVDKFKSFWFKLNDARVKNRQFLSIASKRFSQAISRDNEEDKIIDFLICAEALFLNDIGNIQGELKYRLAQRAANFLEKNAEKRMAIFKFMKSIYDLRSQIVHGEAIKLPKKEDGTKYSLKECCEVIEQYLRKALKKAVNLAINPESPKYLVEWDSLIFQIV